MFTFLNFAREPAKRIQVSRAIFKYLIGIHIMKILQLLLLFSLLSASLVSQAKSSGSCNQGNAKSCFNDALNAMGRKNTSQAINLFVKGCNLGLSRSCSAAGDQYLKVRNYKNAEKYLTLSCNKGNATGCSMLGSYYLDDARPANPKKGLLYKAKACKGGNIGACAVGGTFYSERSLFKQAKPLLDKACYNKKDKVAISAGCNGLANLYSSGDAVAKNKKRALQLYKRACDARTPFSQPACENYKFQSRGFTARERSQAEVACNNMNKIYCYKLALVYRTGKGVKKDNNKAMTYVKKACRAGDKNSCQSYKAYYAPTPSTSSSSSSSNSGSGSTGYKPPPCHNEVYTTCASGVYPCRRVQNTRRICN